MVFFPFDFVNRRRKDLGSEDLGMGLIRRELSLDVESTFIPRPIGEFLREISTIGGLEERLSMLDDFGNRLEEEMRKIDVFKREFPISIVILNDALGVVKEELMRCKKSKIEPVFEEFMPLKKSCEEEKAEEMRKDNKDSRDKKDWLSSVQLWKSDDYSSTNSPVEIKKVTEEENQNSINCLYQIKSCKNTTVEKPLMPPFKGGSGFPAGAATRREEKVKLPTAELSLLTPVLDKNFREESSSVCLSSKSGGTRGRYSSSSPTTQCNLQVVPQQPPQQQQTARKQRRCWSPELHRRFVNALHQLGGSQAATPKQIRDLMHVDGLTNDEVKSHLQKYRLHTRKQPESTSTHETRSDLLLGSPWMNLQDKKQSNSQSSSPEGPLQLAGTTVGTSTTGGDSMEEDDDDEREEEEEDEKSENYTWRNQ